MRRIYRRICLLRATGRTDDAAALANAELTPALTLARIAADTEVEESVLFAQETERVANATLLADLIAPLLAERLRVEMTSLAPRLSASTPSPPAAIGPAPAPSSRTIPDAIPAIADLIDGMLSQQRGAAPPPRGAR